MRGDRIDFFISHAGADRAWAEWVAWQLTDAGYSVELGVWDWAAGTNFVTAMSDALDRAAKVIALFSAAYFERERYTTQEWAATQVYAEQNRLVPVRVEKVPDEKVPPVLRPLIYCDVFGVPEDVARKKLLKAARGPRRPDQPPHFPGRSGSRPEPGPRLPGTRPRIWNVPVRNPAFTGRDQMLVSVRDALLSGERAVVQALHGMGGVGKTQLAIEYAHCFAGAYDLVWWINAEEAELIGEQVADLATELGCADDGAGLAAVHRAVLAELRQRDRWLLVFDNASVPDDIGPWLPGGTGHALITSRAQDWDEIAVPVEVDVLSRLESVTILRDRLPGVPEADADRLAHELGDLPLALIQAVGYMNTGTSVPEYLRLLADRAARLLDEAQPSSHPRTMTAVTQLAFDQLRSGSPAAADVLAVCAFLAPEPVPADWFRRIAPADADPIAWHQVLTRIQQHALARVDGRGIAMHRLTQAILRDLLPAGQGGATRDRAAALLVASRPGDYELPLNWPAWAQLLPHLLALDPEVSMSALSDLADGAAWYLIRRGDPASAYEIANRLWLRRLGDLGPDDPRTLAAAATVSSVLAAQGQSEPARKMAADSLTRSRRVLGPDHPDTLTSASNLANALRARRNYQAASELHQDTLDRRRRVLGEDHPSTLRSAGNLTAALRGLGELQSARELDQDTLERRRRVLGEDHPSTLGLASSLAADLRRLGEVGQALVLDRDTLDRRRRVLGANHPDTLRSASNLAADQRRLGEVGQAMALDRDTLDRRRRVLGANHPDTRRSARNLARDRRALSEA